MLREIEARELQANKELIDETFPAQAAFVRDAATYLAADCTRRAGKSSGLGLKYFRAGRKHNGVLLPYIALTRESAKNIMWPILGEMKIKHGIDCEMIESALTVRMPGDSRIQLFGADTKNFIQRLRGIKTPFAAIDEGQAFRSHIEELVDDILTPAIADFPGCGQLAVTGTPGPVPKGYFFDVTNGKLGFSVHKWSVFQNPYMPHAKEFVADLMKRKGWDETNPTYRREWCGEWVADLDALVYKFDPRINTASHLPATRDWTYVVGIDLGYDPDPTAFVICAYNDYDPNLYIVETYQDTKLIISDVVELVRGYQKKYPGAFLVMDCADKQAVEEMKQRYALPIEAAEKHGKAGFIEMMNSDLRKGVLKIVDGAGDGLIDDWMNLIWDSESEKRKEDSRYANHRPDAALYAWRYCFNYLWKDREIKTSPHSEAKVDEFWEREERKLQDGFEDEESDY